jgi:hypothetical protein
MGDGTPFGIMVQKHCYFGLGFYYFRNLTCTYCGRFNGKQLSYPVKRDFTNIRVMLIDGK